MALDYPLCQSGRSEMPSLLVAVGQITSKQHQRTCTVPVVCVSVEELLQGIPCIPSPSDPPVGPWQRQTMLASQDHDRNTSTQGKY